GRIRADSAYRVLRHFINSESRATQSRLKRTQLACQLYGVVWLAGWGALLGMRRIDADVATLLMCCWLMALGVCMCIVDLAGGAAKLRAEAAAGLARAHSLGYVESYL